MAEIQKMFVSRQIWTRIPRKKRVKLCEELMHLEISEYLSDSVQTNMEPIHKRQLT